MDLLEYVYSLPRYTEKDASYLLSQLFAGLNYLHSQNIVHRNVKPTNTIVSTARSGTDSSRIATRLVLVVLLLLVRPTSPSSVDII